MLLPAFFCVQSGTGCAVNTPNMAMFLGGRLWGIGQSQDLGFSLFVDIDLLDVNLVNLLKFIVAFYYKIIRYFKG